MQLIKPELQGVQRLKALEQNKQLIRGESYMAFVKVTPFYEGGSPYPKLIKYAWVWYYLQEINR